MSWSLHSSFRSNVHWIFMIYAGIARLTLNAPRNAGLICCENRKHFQCIIYQCLHPTNHTRYKYSCLASRKYLNVLWRCYWPLRYIYKNSLFLDVFSIPMFAHLWIKKYTCVDHSIDVQIFTPVPGFRKGTMESYTFIVFSKFLYFHGLVDQHSVGRKTSIL